jgi:hypothetical protein
MTKRVIQVDKNLYFEYEVSPHRRIQRRINSVITRRLGAGQAVEELPKEVAGRTGHDDQLNRKTVTGMQIPFKQVRLKGQINPLKPPVHVETVLIGRALGQRTGYLSGVGFRVRDDGYVEAEFLHGAEKFNSFEEFEKAVTARLQELSDRNS